MTFARDVILACAFLPTFGVDDVLAEGGVATGAGLERVGGGFEGGLDVFGGGGLGDAVGACMEVQRHLGEALSARAHVLTHLLHLG